MLEELDYAEFLKQKFDALIDARSPLEYSHSHLKNALNFYALNSEEHQEIGTLYKKNQAKAKARGAEYICANMARHIPIFTHQFRIGAKVGIYCARGGLRSKSMAVILSELGYRVVRLRGGFKAYRAYLNDFFSKPLQCELLVLCGHTGCGKTELLELLEHSINLEKMANHLGSSFGDILGKQPSQKAFDEALFHSMQTKLAFVEGESRKIGSITLPLKFYEAMQKGFKIHCFASLEKRIERIERLYKAKMNAVNFYTSLRKISPYISLNLRLDLENAFKKEQWQKLIAMLLEYYDKSYKKSSQIHYELLTDDLLRAKKELMALYEERLKVLKQF
ncbi:tRNA 2-selenouridine(34) synthase MnmH [Campylobacter vulpis]|uniref:tRNA 2-selenouridine(34) synthase MnmH n=1 Tax=Campylobacter vulpis TaxID=1655500 RepID=A0ABS5P194_9BACT|nr:tRNA 2-selenouridine(34) synthase MnmH [Campylobacter vulpis]MBS4240455.1 tRNA 2-selenouridine(34) synthase MnmH [Campylobacter vulpis]MBS4251789.1 tRNA 2-selenouridine(34) synthase MnmH [Campylobacter vulpis]MBS4281434.1 tRNA 2-selenouridine(34) synthase MnmH [Campylobacter vulpis]